MFVELSFERLYQLSQLQASVLLRARVFPAVRYFLPRGSEEECVEELSLLLQALQTISDMVMAVVLVVDHPFPNNLNSVLRFVVEHRCVCRAHISHT